MSVKAWKEIVVIPTYEIGKPEKYPMFLEKRVYQGSSGVVYPHPVVETISDDSVDKEWEALYIENNYVKIMILPALGGRVQMAYDKIRERHFVYYNQVIKPALVGLTGPWISGGIEFNWPQHHRPSTYEPTDFRIEENQDGSKTIWVSEVERMFRTKGMAGFTLYPDKAYLEIKVQLFNRTPHPQTFLWWANPAVAVNDHYQSVFPPDVNAVFDHGKRDVSEFPIAKGEYYKVDYSPGTDISRYKNIPVPTSYMAITSDYDFVGGYENDTKGGLLHVADHHVSPGKKQWTWGDGDFGHAWDRNLTETDGPYIELMCGVYTDNQPDFSWLQPYEEKSFKQYFMPYHAVGVVKNASKEALLNLEVSEDKAEVKVYVTSVYPNCEIVLKSNETLYLSEKRDLDPATVFEKTVKIADEHAENLTLEIIDESGNVLVNWCNNTTPPSEIPEPAQPAKAPEEIKSIEQLYLRGLHLEQYRHATYNPMDYYLEALKREPWDVRNNNAVGLWYLKRGQFKKSIPYFDRAIETLTERNPNPYDGEAYFNKGLAHRFLGEDEEAYKALFKSCWNAAWQDAGYFNLAQIDASKENMDRALELIDKSLIRNWHNHRARHLKVLLLRKKGRLNEATQLITESLKIDAFNFGVCYEKYLVSGSSKDLESFKELLRDYAHNYIEVSLEYAQSGQLKTAIELLELYSSGKKNCYPMIHYLLGWYYEQLGDVYQTKAQCQLAQKAPMDYCFPNRLEEVLALQSAIKLNPKDAKAPYYLGNFWYASRQYEEARECWEKASKVDDTNPICLRNLALLYYNKLNQKKKAGQHLEKAYGIDGKDARLLMELDQLNKKNNKPVDQRLALLEDDLQTTLLRDDLYLERASLYNQKGDNQKALDLILQRHFHPWEGGEGKVPFHYILAHVELAKQNFHDGKLQEALDHLVAAQSYPHNLGEGKLYGAQENDIFYWMGCVMDKKGDKTAAKTYWEKASEGLSVPSQAMFYNDQQPDKIFYQGLALTKLGNSEAARLRFENLIQYGMQHMNDEVKLDYFAVSLPDLLIWEDDLNDRNQIHCHYLIGLGNLGLRKVDKAVHAFETVLEKNLYHLQAQLHLNMAKNADYMGVFV